MLTSDLDTARRLLLGKQGVWPGRTTTATMQAQVPLITPRGVRAYAEIKLRDSVIISANQKHRQDQSPRR